MRRSPLLAAVATIAVLVGALSGCSSETQSLETVHVPADAATLQEAADLVAENGTIELANGRYTEAMTIGTDGVTVRGESRDGVIIDGEGKRSTGLTLSGENVTVENLTVTAHLVTGILITGVVDENGEGVGRPRDGYDEPAEVDPPLVSGYAVRYTTTTNNGLYGVYAFNRTSGVLSDNYSSGSADSGFYVGQCDPCAAVVQRNVAELNAIGLEMANASEVVVLGNRFSANRVGVSVQSNYQEAYLPMHSLSFVGNLVSDNDAALTPAVAEGGFGVGLGVSGVTGAEIRSNRITGNPHFGVALTVARDIDTSDVDLDANILEANSIDLAAWGSSQAAVSAICADTLPLTTFPAPWPDALQCAGTDSYEGTEPPAATAVPEGISFLDVSLPGDLPSIPDEVAAQKRPWESGAPDTSTLTAPESDLLIELTQQGGANG